jgi:hypothetical protein
VRSWSCGCIVADQNSIHTLYDKFQVSSNEDEKEQIFFDIVREVRKFKTKHDVLLNYKDNHTVIASKYFSEIFFDRTMEMYTAVNGYFSERLSTTLEKQHECITNIGKMHSNFKKDSKLRKTKKYLINKLELLKSAGKECGRRHTVVSAIATKTETYFTENAFSNIQKV